MNALSFYYETALKDLTDEIADMEKMKRDAYNDWFLYNMRLLKAKDKLKKLTSEMTTTPDVRANKNV